MCVCISVYRLEAQEDHEGHDKHVEGIAGVDEDCHDGRGSRQDAGCRCGHAETKGTGDTPCEQLLVLVIVLQQHEPGLREEMNPNKTVMKAVTRPDVSILSD